MFRILLVIEEYGELVYLQTLLIKLGFDVEGIQNPLKFEETLFSMHPKVIIATAKGKKLDGMKLANIVKKSPEGLPKILLLLPPSLVEKLKGMTLRNIDGFSKTPLEIGHLLITIAIAMEQDPKILINKYKELLEKMKKSDSEQDQQILEKDCGPIDEVQIIRQIQEEQKQFIEEKRETIIEENIEKSPQPVGNTVIQTVVAKSSLSDEERSKRFEKAVQKKMKSDNNFLDVQKVRKFNKEIRSTENADEIADLDEERREFVRSLFSKKKN